LFSTAHFFVCAGDGSFYVAWHWGKLDTDEDNQKTTKTESSPRVKVLECLVMK